MKIHPAAELFPMLAEGALLELAEDIRRHGLLNPIVLLDGAILDGRNRFAACEMVGVVPRFVKWAGTGSPTAWVVSQNLHRRHLSSSQRATLAVELEPLLAKEAEARMLAGKADPTQKVGEGRHDREAAAVAAKLTGTNRQYVSDAKRIAEESPEDFDAIKRGEKTISEVKRAPAVLVGKPSKQSPFETAHRKKKPKAPRQAVAITLVVPRDLAEEVMERLEGMGCHRTGDRSMRFGDQATRRSA